MAIKFFKGRYKFLSNSFPTLVHIGREEYPSVEHALLASRYLSESERLKISEMNLRSARHYAKNHPPRGDWEDIRDTLLEVLLSQKFKGPLAESLILTGEEDLIFGNHWHDCHLGKCYCPKCKGRGKNILGKNLMSLRTETLRKAVQEAVLGSKIASETQQPLF